MIGRGDFTEKAYKWYPGLQSIQLSPTDDRKETMHKSQQLSVFSSIVYKAVQASILISVWSNIYAPAPAV